MKSRVIRAVAFAGIAAAAASRAGAVIVYGDPGNNYLTGSSSVPVTTNGQPLDQYEGGIDGFLGTAISSKYFVTANHINGNKTDTFAYRNGTDTYTNYSVMKVGVQDDLAIWEISPSTPDASFADWAPLYTGSNELGQSLVVIGNGTARGEAVTGGWAWGNSAPASTWGANTVSATPDASDIGAPSGFGGSFLQFTFYNSTDPRFNGNNEAITSGGDSGGGVFVQDPSDGVYKLAGINSLVDQVLDANGNPVYAALYDDNGYYYRDSSGALQPITDHDPLSSYATRLSTRIDYIDSVTGLPEPGCAVWIAAAAMIPLRRRSRG